MNPLDRSQSTRPHARFPLRRNALASIAAAVCLLGFAASSHAVELRISRAALERTLQQQLFGGPQGRYYLKGSTTSACSVYAEQPSLRFNSDRVAVRIRIHARLGKPFEGRCVGVGLSPSAEVSLIPDAQGESVGFRDARMEHVSESRELNFLLMPFLSHEIPSSLKVNAADLLRKALQGSTLKSGYDITLDRLKIHSITLDGDWLVVDTDGDLSVQ